MKKIFISLILFVLSGGFSVAEAVGIATTYPAEISDFPGTVVLRGRAEASLSGENYIREAYFEWGEGYSFNRTTRRERVYPYLRSNQDMRFVLNNLNSNITYSFRLVVIDPEMGQFFGETKTFRPRGQETSSGQLAYSGSASAGNTSTYSYGSTQNNQGTVNNSSSYNNTQTNSQDSTVTANTKSENNQSNTSTFSNFWSSLFSRKGEEDVNGQNTRESDIEILSENTLEEKSGLLPKTVLGWVFLSTILFMTVALWIYVASLYERLKEARKKREEKRFTPEAPMNLPIA